MKLHTIDLNTINSTQTWAKEHVAIFDKEALTCISATSQTHGKGRFQRKWHSPKTQNIYATFFFVLPKNTSVTSLAQIMTLSLAKVLKQKDCKIHVKWPNDLYLEGKKLAGVLCETLFDTDFTSVFLGIGVNVNMEQEELNKIDQKATSLKVETQKTWDTKALLKELTRSFTEDLNLFKIQGFEPFHKTFEDLMLYKGEQITCRIADQQYEGICHSLTSSGALNLLLPSQKMMVISSADIEKLNRK